jgi:hypothetical protein
MDQDRPERPVGVTVAAALIAFIGIVSVFARLRGADWNLLSAVWLVVHVTSLAVAFGLWAIKRWAYWLFIAFVVGGVVVTVTRLVSQGSSHGPGYHLLRLGIMAAWLVYFSRWQVRGAFAPPGSGYGR